MKKLLQPAMAAFIIGTSAHAADATQITPNNGFIPNTSTRDVQLEVILRTSKTPPLGTGWKKTGEDMQYWYDDDSGWNAKVTGYFYTRAI